MRGIRVELEYQSGVETVPGVGDPRQFVDEVLTNQQRKKDLKKIYVNGDLWWECANYKLNKK